MNKLKFINKSNNNLLFDKMIRLKDFVFSLNNEILEVIKLACEYGDINIEFYKESDDFYKIYLLQKRRVLIQEAINKIEEFIALNEQKKSLEEIQGFITTNLPNAQEVFAKAFTDLCVKLLVHVVQFEPLLVLR